MIRLIEYDQVEIAAEKETATFQLRIQRNDQTFFRIGVKEKDLLEKTINGRLLLEVTCKVTPLRELEEEKGGVIRQRFDATQKLNILSSSQIYSTQMTFWKKMEVYKWKRLYI